MFRLNDLAKVIPESVPIGDMDIGWEFLSIDSRTIKPGDLFFALKGERYDGHQFIRDACEKGASGVVIEKKFFDNHPSIFEEYRKPLLLVDNSLFALQLWAHYYYSLFQPLNICITGSNGKTTTKEMIAHLLTPRYHVLKSQGNYNNEIGVPLTVLGLTSYHDVIVIEMAARKLGEIKDLINIVKPDIAVITNVGEAHIGLFGSKDNIAKDKSEIVLALKNKGTVILNRDDSYFNYFKNCASHQNDVISFGFHPEADFRAVNFRQENGIHFDLLLTGEKIHHILIPLLGKFNVYNALAAMAVGIKMNISINELIRCMSNFKSLKMHMEYLDFHRGITLIKDYYNANPTAMEEALISVAGISEGRFKVAVLGDMLELGPESPDYHKKVGEKAASLCYDMVIGLGEYSGYISQGAQEQGMAKDRIYQFDRENKEKLTNHLMESIPDHSIVLLKGSRDMKMEDIVQHWETNEKMKEKGDHA